MQIYLTNLLGIVFTLGLYTPWAQLRLMRYRLGAMSVEVPGRWMPSWPDRGPGRGCGR